MTRPGSASTGASPGSWSTTRQVSIQSQVGCGFSLNRLVVLPIHLPCAIGGDPYTCGWDDRTGGHRWQTRSQRLNLALVAARLPGRLTATTGMGVRFRIVRCAVWQSELRKDRPGDTAADHDLIRPGRCFGRESLGGWDSTTAEASPASPEVSAGGDDVPRVTGTHRQRSSKLTMTTQPKGLCGNPHPDPGNIAHPMFPLLSA